MYETDEGQKKTLWRWATRNTILFSLFLGFRLVCFVQMLIKNIPRRQCYPHLLHTHVKDFH